MEGSAYEAANPFVGRSRDLGRIESYLDDALRGRGRLVLCTGEAGIGKTRLAEESALAANARGMTVAWARATDRDSSPPYGLWRLALAAHDAAGLDLWSEVFERSDPPALSEGLDAASAQRFAMFADVFRRLASAAERDGLLLVLDDLQWADPASLALLVEVVRQLRRTRIVVVGTYRAASSTGDAGLHRLSADSATERVDLEGLSPAAVGELLRACGLSALPDDVDLVSTETGGNPFLVREIAQVLLAQGGSPGISMPVPDRVLEATTHRLTQMSKPAKEFLRAAAVAGNGFSIGVVAKMLDRAVLGLLDALDECQTAGFIVSGDRPGDHRFSHALVRSAVEAQLGASQQQRLHTAASDAIEALFEGQVRSHLAEIARHRVAGSLPGSRHLAAAACETAAEVAFAALAYEEAARLYRQALAIGEGEADDSDRVRLELGLAAALYGSGDLPGSFDAAVRVGRRAERDRDWPALAGVALVVEATGQTVWDAELCRFCEGALSGDLPDNLRARVASRYAQTLVYRGQYDRAGEVSRDALSVAEASGDPIALVDALRARQMACCSPDGSVERAELAARMLETARAVDSPWVEMWGRLWHLDTLLETGELTSAQRALVDVELCLRRLHGPLGRWHFLEYSATLAVATGRFGEAKRLGGEAFELISAMGHPLAFGSYAAILGQVGLHIGFDASGMAELFGRLPTQFKPDVTDTTNSVSSVFPALSVGMIRLQQGDRAGAEAAYAQAGPVESWVPSPALCLSCWAHGLAVAIGLGKTEDVSFLAERFEPFRGRHVANGAGAGIYMGPVELQLGKAEAATNWLVAVADLQTARSLCAANGARGYGVEASVELAAALGRLGDGAEALAVLDQAATEAERLGMQPFVSRIADLRWSLSGATTASPLSRREQEVAQLVAQGLTNKQIADKLFLSERTAENHVRHILEKLGLSNRTQIAAWSARQ